MALGDNFGSLAQIYAQSQTAPPIQSMLGGMRQGQQFVQNNQQMGQERQALFNDMQQQKLEWGQTQHAMAKDAIKDILATYKIDPTGKLGRAVFGTYEPGLLHSGVNVSPYKSIFDTTAAAVQEANRSEQAAARQSAKADEWKSGMQHGYNVVPSLSLENIGQASVTPQGQFAYPRVDPPKPFVSERLGAIIDPSTGTAKPISGLPEGAASGIGGDVGQIMAIMSQTGKPWEAAKLEYTDIKRKQGEPHYVTDASGRVRAIYRWNPSTQQVESLPVPAAGAVGGNTSEGGNSVDFSTWK